MEPLRRSWLLVLSILATTNAMLALVLSFRLPIRGEDLWVMRHWVRQWLFDNHRLYVSPSSDVDYPPWAIVTLSPLGLIPDAWAVASWALLNIAATGVAFRVLTVIARPAETGAALALPALLVSCWGGTRSVLMFTPLMMAAGLLAIHFARRPLVSGVLLAVSAAKPPIALPFVIWALAARKYRHLFVAALALLAEYLVYVWWTGPIFRPTWLHWLRVIDRLYAGPSGDALHGLTSTRELAASLLRPPLVDTFMIAWLAIGVAVILLVALRMERRQDPRRIILTIALGHLWSLMCFYHLTNNMLLLAPAFFAIYAGRDAWPPIGRRAMLVLLQLGMMLDIAPRVSELPDGPIVAVLANLNRILVFGVLGYLALSIRRNLAVHFPDVPEDYRRAQS